MKNAPNSFREQRNAPLNQTDNEVNADNRPSLIELENDFLVANATVYGKPLSVTMF